MSLKKLSELKLEIILLLGLLLVYILALYLIPQTLFRVPQSERRQADELARTAWEGTTERGSRAAAMESSGRRGPQQESDRTGATTIEDAEAPLATMEADAHPRYRYPALTFEERELLARMVYHEARGEPPDGQQAAVEVALNRLISDRFGYADSVHEVIFAPGQFAVAVYIYTGEPWQAQYDAVDAAMYGEPILSIDYLYFNTHPITRREIVQIGNHFFSK